MDNDRETAVDTLRAPRQVLAEVIRVLTVHGSTPTPADTRRVLEVEIGTLEAARRDWDDHAAT